MITSKTEPKQTLPGVAAGGLSLRANFSWTFVGNLVYAGTQWGTLAALTKLGTTEMVGQFALGLAITTPIIMLTNLQLRTVQATDARERYHFADYLSLRLLTILIALLVLGTLLLFAGYTRATAAVILAVGISKAVEAVSDLFYGFLQQRERMDRIAQSLLLRGPLAMIAMIAGLYWSGSLLWGIVGMIGAWAVVLIGWDLRCTAWLLADATALGERPLWPRWQWQRLGQLAWLALPLGVVMMLLTLNGNIPRYFVEEQLGTSALGIFAAIAYLNVAGGTVVTALGQSVSPRLAKYCAAGEIAAFRHLLLQMVGIGLLLGAGGVAVAWLAGRPLLTLIYAEAYVAADLFVWIMLAAAVAYVASFLGYGITAARYFRIQIPLFAVVALATALACWWLVPGRGLVGAAMALLIGAGVQTAISAVVILRIR